MRRIRWSRAARRDYRDVIEWLSDRNPAAAESLADIIGSRLETLAAMPRLGRVGRVADTRELVIAGTPYVAVYRLDDADQEIVVLRLLHAAQQWPPRRR